MLRYSIKRLLQGVITVWFIATATFVAMHAVPGDPLIHDKAVTAQIRKNLEIKYGLDKPVVQQYLIYMGNMLRGDFGISFTQQNRSVNDIIVKHFPVSATLGILAIVFAALGGILWGALTALYRNRLPDIVIMFLVILGISVPSFVFAALGQLALVNINALFGRTLLPVAGWGTVSHMIVPSLVLGLGTMAFLTRLMRSSMLEIVNADYVRTARAKGLADDADLPEARAAQRDPAGDHRARPRDRRHHDRRIRRRTRVRDSRPRPLLRAGRAAARLHRDHGNDGVLWGVPRVHGHRRRHRCTASSIRAFGSSNDGRQP